MQSIFCDHNGNVTRNKQQKEKEKNHKNAKVILFKKQWVIEEITGENRKYLDMNENENTTCYNLQNSAKALLRGKL